MKNDFLKEVTLKKKEKLTIKKNELPLEALKEKLNSFSKKPISFYKAISKKSKLCLIAEIKKSSPSQGILREDFDPLKIASDYKEVGADSLSVLTEEDYFGGSLSYISIIKEKIDLPILRKDFIVDIYEVYETKLAGADALLLIVELFSKETLSEYLEVAENLGLDCLLEINSEKDLKRALSLKKAKIIGINNRNLHTLEVDLKTTEKLFPLIPKDKIVVVESGISNYKDVLFLKVLGVNAVLIGSAFMTASDIKSKVKEIMGWQ
jgi:indole-3-glycerol phosphate synthase